MVETWTRPKPADWGEGLWNEEPDKEIWIDPNTDLDCMLNRNHFGSWCGYVGVGPDHPWYEHPYQDLDLNVHGGLTYSDYCHETDDPAEGICHVARPGRSKRIWWFGFDCGHYMDLTPGMEFMTRKYEITPQEELVYRDMDYARRQVNLLAKQIAEARR